VNCSGSGRNSSRRRRRRRRQHPARPGRRPSDVVSRHWGPPSAGWRRRRRRRAITAIGRRNYTISRHDVAAAASARARTSYTIYPSCLGFANGARRRRAGGQPTGPDWTSRWDWKRLIRQRQRPTRSRHYRRRPTLGERNASLHRLGPWDSRRASEKIIIGQMMWKAGRRKPGQPCSERRCVQQIASASD